MARYDFRTHRLFVDRGLRPGERLPLDRRQANYLVNVLRMGDGQGLLVFNGRDGEWRATLASEGRKSHALVVGEQTRPQPARPDLDYLFAPLKQARLDYMVEKAVEMGAGRLRPVLTQHGQVTRINRQRMEANAIEAAEQCGILAIPTVDEPVALATLVDNWPDTEPGRRIVFCDEGHPGEDPVAILSRRDALSPRGADRPGGWLLGGGTGPAPRPPLRHGAPPRPPNPARRHRRRRGAGAGSGRAGRLACHTSRRRLTDDESRLKSIYQG